MKEYVGVKTNALRILPAWVPKLYLFLGIATIPWTVFLAITLPTRHVTHHWDVAWVGLDIAIITLLLLNALFMARASRWLVISATGTAALLVTDAWFDILSSRYGMQLYEAIGLAAIIELPLAMLTLSIAIKTLNRFAENSTVHRKK
jgi:hypothetical protein